MWECIAPWYEYWQHKLRTMGFVSDHGFQTFTSSQLSCNTNQCNVRFLNALMLNLVQLTLSDFWVLESLTRFNVWDSRGKYCSWSSAVEGFKFTKPVCILKLCLLWTKSSIDLDKLWWNSAELELTMQAPFDNKTFMKFMKVWSMQSAVPESANPTFLQYVDLPASQVFEVALYPRVEEEEISEPGKVLQLVITISLRYHRLLRVSNLQNLSKFWSCVCGGQSLALALTNYDGILRSLDLRCSRCRHQTPFDNKTF